MADAYFFFQRDRLSFANGFDTFTTCFYPGKSLSNSITACKVVFARRNGTATGVFATWPQTGHVSTKARTNTDRFATRLYKFTTHFAKYLSKLLRRMSSCWLRLIKKRLHLKADGSFTLPADK